MTQLRIKNESGFPLAYATNGAIGLDLRAVISNKERLIEPWRRFKFDTGISIELPDGFGAFVKPRSGLFLNYGVKAAEGVIDQDYRGRICVVLSNTSGDPYKVLHGDRIAQLVIQRVDRVEIVEVAELEITERGASGFGSTGR